MHKVFTNNTFLAFLGLGVFSAVGNWCVRMWIIVQNKNWNRPGSSAVLFCALCHPITEELCIHVSIMYEQQKLLPSKNLEKKQSSKLLQMWWREERKGGESGRALRRGSGSNIISLCRWFGYSHGVCPRASAYILLSLHLEGGDEQTHTQTQVCTTGDPHWHNSFCVAWGLFQDEKSECCNGRSSDYAIKNAAQTAFFVT